MPETEAPQQQPNAAAAPAEGATGPEAPAPWGEDFDPARAWKTIQAQRDEAKTLREELGKFRKAQQDAEEAEKTEAQKAAEQATKAEAQMKAAQREVWKLRAAVKHSLPEELAELLSGETEEDVQKVAERLAGYVTKATGEAGPPSKKPKPALTPGESAPDASAKFDPVAIAEAARKSFVY
jgi:hypothetical protein